eukprot:1149458-Pelagomonas_calceolata.AAC.1
MSAGARVKVTRSLVYGQDPEGQLPPLLSFGTGLNVDMDKQRLEPDCCMPPFWQPDQGQDI